MTCADLKRSLREKAGGDWISKRKLKAWLQGGDAEVEAVTNGLKVKVFGRSKLYWVPDVAERVMFNVCRGW